MDRDVGGECGLGVVFGGRASCTWRRLVCSRGAEDLPYLVIEGRLDEGGEALDGDRSLSDFSVKV